MEVCFNSFFSHNKKLGETVKSCDRIEIKDGVRPMFTLEQMKVQQPHKISLFTITKSSLVIYKGNMFATESKEDLKNWLFDIWVQLFVI